MSLVSTSAKGSSPLTTKGDLFGFSTVNDRIPIGADNFVLTADAAQTLGLKWAATAGALTQVFDSVLAAPATSIDTGANGVPQTGTHLLVIGSGRCSAGVITQAGTTFLNNDVSAIYDAINVTGTSTTPASSSAAQNQPGWAVSYPGTSGDANAFASWILWIPDYRGSHNRNMITLYGRIPQSGVLTSYAIQIAFLNYRSTTAVSRVAMNLAANNFAAGSRLSVYTVT